jgi:hypothetical protein
LTVPCIAIFVCMLVRQFDPPPFYLRVIRFQVQGYRPESTTKGLFWIFAILIVPLAIIACTAIERRVAVWTMGAFATGAAISSVVAITDLTGITPRVGQLLARGTVSRAPMFGAFGESYENGRMPGLADHPNTLGFTVMISIPIMVYFMGTMRWKWIPAVVLVALFGGVVVSGSRAAQALAPLVAVAAALCLPNRRSLTRFFSIFGLAVVAGIVGLLLYLPGNIRPKVFRVIQGLNADKYVISPEQASDADRVTLLRTGVADWEKYPVFGAGIRHIVEAHNIYLQLLAAGGVVLLMAMLVFWFWMLRDCWQLSKLGIVYARFLMVSIGVWLVLGMIENSMTERFLYFTVGCIAALASATLVHGQDGAQAPDDLAKAI